MKQGYNTMNTYKTRIDRWLIVVLLVPMLLVVGLGFYLYPSFPAEALMCWGTLLFSASLVAVIGFPCEYTLDTDHLLIRSGVIRYRIPYADITHVAKSNSLWSSPAWSLQRIKIDYGTRKFILVSPQDRDAFINALQSKTPVSP